MITAGLKNLMPDVSKAIAEARVEGKGVDPVYYLFRLLLTILFLFHYICTPYLVLWQQIFSFVIHRC